MSELGTAFFQFALAQLACQATGQTHGYSEAMKNLEYTSEQLAEAFYNAEIVDPFGAEAKESE